eukprot:13915155-Alexandrium_andersonii.AAC.1
MPRTSSRCSASPSTPRARRCSPLASSATWRRPTTCCPSTPSEQLPTDRPPEASSTCPRTGPT